MADNEPDDDLVDYDEEEVRLQNIQCCCSRQSTVMVIFFT
jgi:hypothetical protein